MLRRSQLSAAVSKIKLAPVHGPWSRAIAYRSLLHPPPGVYAPPEPLWGGASKIVGARFTPKGGFDSIYLACDPITAFLEVSALIFLPGGPVPVRSVPWVIISVDGVVNNVLDLTHGATLAALGTNEQEISGSWTRMKNPPTQLLAQLAFDSGAIAGIKYGSAKHPGGFNLVVFPERVIAQSGNYLEVYDPYGNLTQRIGA